MILLSNYDIKKTDQSFRFALKLKIKSLEESDLLLY